MEDEGGRVPSRRNPAEEFAGAEDRDRIGVGFGDEQAIVHQRQRVRCAALASWAGWRIVQRHRHDAARGVDD
jgi:hypothetical protein